MDPWKLYFLLKMGICHCYVSLPESTWVFLASSQKNSSKLGWFQLKYFWNVHDPKIRGKMDSIWLQSYFSKGVVDSTTNQSSKWMSSSSHPPSTWRSTISWWDSWNAGSFEFFKVHPPLVGKSSKSWDTLGGLHFLKHEKKEINDQWVISIIAMRLMKPWFDGDQEKDKDIDHSKNRFLRTRSQKPYQNYPWKETKGFLGARKLNWIHHSDPILKAHFFFAGSLKHWGSLSSSNSHFGS